MAGPFDFVSPGAAFSDQLTNALVERKAQERQSLLDSLGIRAQQRADAEADRMKQYQDYEMKMGGERNERENLATLQSTLLGGTPISSLTPDNQQLLQKHGMTHMQTTPFSPGVMGQDSAAGSTPNQAPAMPQQQEVYSGSLQEQEGDKLKQSDAQLVNSLTDPIMKAAAQKDLQANGGYLSPQFKASMQPHIAAMWDVEGKHPRLVDGNGNEIKLGPNGQVPFGIDVHGIKPFKPYNPPQPREQASGYSKGPDGKIYRVYIVNGREVLGTNPVEEPKSYQQPSTEIKWDKGAAAAYKKDSAAFTAQPNKMTGAAMMASALNQIRMIPNVPQKVKDVTSVVLSSDPDTAKKAIAGMTEENGWKPEEVEQYKTILQSVWPPSIAQQYNQLKNSGGATGYIKNFLFSPDSTSEPMKPQVTPNGMS